jgi:hypothetical protein
VEDWLAVGFKWQGDMRSEVLLHTPANVVEVRAAGAEHVPASDNSEKKIHWIGSGKSDRAEPGPGPVL